jgi:hypothetical protein
MGGPIAQARLNLFSIKHYYYYYCLGCMSGKCLPSTGNDNETDCRLCAEGKCLSPAG